MATPITPDMMGTSPEPPPEDPSPKEMGFKDAPREPEPPETEDDWKQVAYRLWRIIDDIDTISDMAKGNDRVYRQLVEKKQSMRGEVLPEKIVDELYERFYIEPKFDGGDGPETVGDMFQIIEWPDGENPDPKRNP